MYRPLLAAAAAFTLVALACDSDNDDSPTETTPTTEAAAGCSPARPHAAGETRETISHGGIDRAYLLAVPASYDGASPTAVVVALHGLGGTAEALRDMTALARDAGERGMITVFPQGAGQTPGWNFEKFVVGPDDSAFLNTLIDGLEASLCIDPDRMYVTGYSNGGGMALRFACESGERLAAIAVVGATYPICQGDAPLVAFHGNADPVVPYEGGSAPGAPSHAPVHRSTSEWARALGCDGLPLISRAAPDVELAEYQRCPETDETLLYTVIGGGHTWPGAAIELDPALAGATTRSVSANAIMLDFFEAHERNP